MPAALARIVAMKPVAVATLAFVRVVLATRVASRPSAVLMSDLGAVSRAWFLRA